MYGRSRYRSSIQMQSGNQDGRQTPRKTTIRRDGLSRRRVPFFTAGHMTRRLYGILAESQARRRGLEAGTELADRSRDTESTGCSSSRHDRSVDRRWPASTFAFRDVLCNFLSDLGRSGFRSVRWRTESVRHVRPGDHSEQLGVMVLSDTVGRSGCHVCTNPRVRAARSIVTPLLRAHLRISAPSRVVKEPGRPRRKMRHDIRTCSCCARYREHRRRT